MKSIYKILMISLLTITISSCTKDGLEDYFVQATESADFLVMNIPANIVEFDTEKLDKKTLQQIKSIKKLKILIYKNNYEKRQKEKELQKLQQILNNKKYNVLTKIKNKDYQIVLSYEGKPEAINKLIFLGIDNENNFLLGLIKGKKVNVKNISKSLKHIKSINSSQTDDLIESITKSL